MYDIFSSGKASQLERSDARWDECWFVVCDALRLSNLESCAAAKDKNIPRKPKPCNPALTAQLAEDYAMVPSCTSQA